MTSLSLVVLRADDPERLARFYSAFGLAFLTEQHAHGPPHKACDLGGFVLEIYPAQPDAPSTSGARLGFVVPSVVAALSACDGATVVSPARRSKWGYRAVVKDPEGHTIELTEKPAPSESQ